MQPSRFCKLTRIDRCSWGWRRRVTRPHPWCSCRLSAQHASSTTSRRNRGTKRHLHAAGLISQAEPRSEHNPERCKESSRDIPNLKRERLKVVKAIPFLVVHVDDLRRCEHHAEDDRSEFLRESVRRELASRLSSLRHSIITTRVESLQKCE